MLYVVVIPKNTTSLVPFPFYVKVWYLDISSFDVIGLSLNFLGFPNMDCNKFDDSFAEKIGMEFDLI